MRHGRETERKESDERKTEWTKTPGVCLSAKVETHSVFPTARILLIRWETDLHLCWSQKPVWVRVRTQWQGQLPPGCLIPPNTENASADLQGTYLPVPLLKDAGKRKAR